MPVFDCKRIHIRKVDFDSAEAAEDWIDANQLARRNLKPDSFTLALGRRYNRTKEQGARTDLTSVQKEHKSTAEALSEEHGVSAMTVRRAGKIAEEVEAKPELKYTAVVLPCGWFWSGKRRRTAPLLAGLFPITKENQRPA